MLLIGRVDLELTPCMESPKNFPMNPKSNHQLSNLKLRTGMIKIGSITKNKSTRIVHAMKLSKNKMEKRLCF